MPDAIPIAGLTDDLTVLLYALNKVWTSIDDDIKKQAQDKLSKWFDDDEMNVAEDLFAEDILITQYKKVERGIYVAVCCLSHSDFISCRLCGLSYVAIVSSSK